jgi:hypothetical protein
VRATRTVVRPGRKNGGTTLVFRLARPTKLRITIVRVYPKCSVVGSFVIRARGGVNRIRFRGRFRGRPLPAGGYRLIIRARGAARDAAAVPIVVARSPVSRAALRKARSTVACTKRVADFEGVAAIEAGGSDGSGGLLATVTKRVKEPVTSAAGAITRAAGGVAGRVKDASDGLFDNRFVLTLVGVIALISAILGGMVLVQAARSTRYRHF